MEYQGFHSIGEYETECARVGHSTRRVSFRKGADKFFALITTPPGHQPGPVGKPWTSVESWTLFSADESARLLDGVINGHPANYLDKLAAQGYFPDGDQLQSAPAPAPELPADDSGHLCFVF